MARAAKLKPDLLATFTATQTSHAKTAEAAVITANTNGDTTKIKGQTLRLNIDAWKQLKILAMDEDKNVHELLIEAVNALFVSRGQPPIA